MATLYLTPETKDSSGQGIDQILFYASNISMADKTTVQAAITTLRGYFTSGSANTAVKLGTSAGSATQPVYFSGGKPVACTYTLGKSVPSDAVFTDTKYTHPTTSGNKHIPSGGSSGQILRWSADGTAVWGADNNTTYSVMGAATSSAAGTSGLVPAPGAGKHTSFLRGDGTWVVPTNTTYSAGDGISLSGTTFTNSGVRSIATGSTNGTISVNTGGTSAEVAVKGLGSAAYTASSAYAAASHTHNYAGSGSAGGSANSAVKLATARTLDGVSFDGSAAITHYGTCDTAAATAAKVVSLTGFTLVTGARVAVKFTVTNTASSPTLNVNSTGAKAIQYRGSAISAGYLAANRLYEFIYDGSAYQLVGDINVDTNTDTKVTNTLGTTTKAYVTGTTSSSTNTGTQIFDTGVFLETTAGGLRMTRLNIADKGIFTYDSTKKAIKISVS